MSLIVLVAFSAGSCSKKSYSYSASSKSTSFDPASRKSHPPRKKYVVPSRKKTILGQEKR